jgi:hypothetical protein
MEGHGPDLDEIMSEIEAAADLSLADSGAGEDE